MDNIKMYQRLFEYAALKFYRVDTIGYHRIHGILLNYSSSAIVLLAEDGIVHIPSDEILKLHPYNPESFLFQDPEYLKILIDLGIKQIKVDSNKEELYKDTNVEG